jgi:predicted ATPase
MSIYTSVQLKKFTKYNNTLISVVNKRKVIFICNCGNYIESYITYICKLSWKGKCINCKNLLSTIQIKNNIASTFARHIAEKKIKDLTHINVNIDKIQPTKPIYLTDIINTTPYGSTKGTTDIIDTTNLDLLANVVCLENMLNTFSIHAFKTNNHTFFKKIFEINQHINNYNFS